jgi:hypothetical protein
VSDLYGDARATHVLNTQLTTNNDLTVNNFHHFALAHYESLVGLFKFLVQLRKENFFLVIDGSGHIDDNADGQPVRAKNE